MRGLRIVATGRALPERTVTNDDMSRLVDTSDEWIVSRSGIKERRFCGEGENSALLAARAARQALERSGIAPEELAACLVATVSPLYATPSNGCVVQQALGLPEEVPCFDISVGCTGFVYGLQIARGLLLQDERPYALVVGAEALSHIMDFTDRSTCVLFGDGAGAAVVRLEEGAPYACVLGAQGAPEALWAQGPGAEPSHIHMDGRAVFRFAVEAIPRVVRTLLDQSGLTMDQVDWIVPHQANRRIVEGAARRLGLPMEKFFLNLDHYGNTSAASIPLALDEMGERGLLTRGQTVICAGFGAGLTWGGALLEW